MTSSDNSGSGVERATPPGPRTRAHTRARELLSAVQSDAPEQALRDVVAARQEAERRNWPEVEIVLRYAEVVYALVLEPAEAASRAAALLERAEELDSSVGMSLALSGEAEVALGRDDVASHIEFAAVAVALLDDGRGSPEDRAQAYNGCGVAYHALRLWELAEEFYAKAASLLTGDAPTHGLRGEITVNRTLALVEELLSLIELGHKDEARRLFEQRGTAILAENGDPDMPMRWEASLRAAQMACRLLGATPTGGMLHEAAALLDHAAEGHDIGGLPALHLALAHVRLQADDVESAEQSVTAASILSDREAVELATRSFALWLRAEIAMRRHPSPSDAAHTGYQAELAQSAWASRRALLAAARSRIQAERLRNERDRYAEQSLLDELTGVANRRGLERHFDLMREPSTLLLVDIDGFKATNDRLGHAVGDEVLRRLGRLLREHVRSNDFAARLGGDEFVVIFGGADLDVARERGDALQQAVRAEQWSEVAPGLDVSVSIGLSAGSGGRGLYRTADQAMYAAKKAGGGRVVAGGDATRGAVDDA